jgi:hypothetical protein
LVKDFVRAWLGFLDLSNNLIIGFLGSEEFNWGLNIVSLAKKFCFFCLIFEGSLSLNDVSLSNHKFNLGMIRN